MIISSLYFLFVNLIKNNYMKEMRFAYEYSEKMEHDKWQLEIPYIRFRPEWDVQICPPFSGAMVRFRVKYKKAEVSIYLDCYDALGCVGVPYWEVYPIDNDVDRIEMRNIDMLLKSIARSIKQQNKPPLPEI